MKYLGKQYGYATVISIPEYEGQRDQQDRGIEYLPDDVGKVNQKTS